MQKVFNNPEILDTTSIEAFSESAMIIIEARLRMARIEGFKAGHACQKDHPEIPLELAIKRWENDEPNPPRRIF